MPSAKQGRHRLEMGAFLHENRLAPVKRHFAEGVLVVHGLGQTDDFVEQPRPRRRRADRSAVGVAQPPGRLANS